MLLRTVYLFEATFCTWASIFPEIFSAQVCSSFWDNPERNWKIIRGVNVPRWYIKIHFLWKIYCYLLMWDRFIYFYVWYLDINQIKNKLFGFIWKVCLKIIQGAQTITQSMSLNFKTFEIHTIASQNKI